MTKTCPPIRETIPAQSQGPLLALLPRYLLSLDVCIGIAAVEHNRITTISFAAWRREARRGSIPSQTPSPSSLGPKCQPPFFLRKRLGQSISVLCRVFDVIMKYIRLGPHEDFDPDSSSIYSETGAATSGISSTSLSRTNSADSQAEEHYSRSQTAAALKALERLREMKANSRLSGTSGLPSTVRPRIISADSVHSRSPSALKVLEHLQETKTNPQPSKSSFRSDIPKSLQPKNSTYSTIARSGSTLESIADPSHRSVDFIRGSSSSPSADVTKNAAEASGSGSTSRENVAKLLINEVKEIKREMEVMRAGAVPLAVEEPPPSYQG